MAIASPSSAETLQPKLEKSDVEPPSVASMLPSSIETSTADSSSSTTLAAGVPVENPSSNLANPSLTLYSNPTPGLNQTPAVIAPPAAPSFTPSFRPFGAPSIPQYTTVPNPSIQPPGVSAPLVSVTPMIPGSMYTVPPGLQHASATLPYGSNGYMTVPVPAPHVFPPPVDHV